MNYGHFFKADIDHSDFSRGAGLFRYQRAEEGGCVNVAITSTEIRFLFHRTDQVVMPLFALAPDSDALSQQIDGICFTQLPVGLVIPDHADGYGSATGSARLWLDFMFDLFHSEVFHISPFCQPTVEKLMRCPLFRLIRWYHEYRYQMADADNSRLPFAAEAEGAWVRCLAADDADDLVFRSPWFSRSVTDYLDEVSRQAPAPVYGSSHQAEAMADAAFRACLRRYDLAGALSLLTRRRHRRGLLLELFLPRLLAAIAAAWFPLVAVYYRGGIAERIPWIALVVLGLVTVVYLVYEIYKKNPHEATGRIVGRSAVVVVMALSYSVLFGILLLQITGLAATSHATLRFVAASITAIFTGLFINTLMR